VPGPGHCRGGHGGAEPLRVGQINEVSVPVDPFAIDRSGRHAAQAQCGEVGVLVDGRQKERLARRHADAHRQEPQGLPHQVTPRW